MRNDPRGLKRVCLETWCSILFCCGGCILAADDSAAADRAHTVNIYAWSEYYPPAVIAKFQAETGLHVNYSVFDSPDTAETALSVGNSNYDIVTMNGWPHLAREIPKNFWRRLDKDKIPNVRNANPQIMTLLGTIDPGNEHAVPWMWGTVGIIYNPAKIKAAGNLPTNALDLILDRGIAAKFEKCGINLLDSWQDILPMVANYLGQSTLSTEPAKIDAIMAKLRQVRPFVRSITSSGYYEQLASGDLCLALGYSGDAMVARRMVREANSGKQIEYAFVMGAVPLYVDSMVIPADSPNYAGALAFINFMMRPEVAAQVTQFIGFASGNGAAVPLLEAALRNNPIVYPPADVRARFVTERVYSADELRIFTRAWQRFKSGQ